MNITIEDMQAYLHERYGSCGNDLGLFMKLVEETGEVAEVLNKRDGRKAAAQSDAQEALGEELADVIHYAMAIAAVNGINLTDVILSKDKRASAKYGHDINLETFIAQRGKES